MADLDLNQLKQEIKKKTIDTVIVAFPDHFGQLMGKRLNAEFFLSHPQVETCSYLLTTNIEMEPLHGFALGSWEQGYGDFRISVEGESFKVLAWEPSTALVIGDLLDKNGHAVAQSPREVLTRQVNRSLEMGFRPMMASELEFFLFENSFKKVTADGYSAIEPSASYPIDYHILGTGYNEQTIRQIRELMSASGISVESSKGETGYGQHEIAIEYDEALKMADQHVIYKYGTKTIVAAAEKSVTFMAKYTDADAGSSCHIHASLADPKTGKNLFSEEGSRGEPREESLVFRHFLGGLHHLSAELFLFFAPNVNSYKRYTAGSFAPTHLAWDYDNRTTSFRVVGEGQGFRIENRMPGADANPYLAFSAMLAAGLYGIEHGIEPPERFNGDAYRDDQLGRLPLSLEEAAANLDRSTIGRELFGDEVIDHYVRHAKLEAEEYRKVVGEWELKRYFERI